MEDTSMPITPGDYADLERMVKELRQQSFARASIPAHSGSVGSEERKRRRAQRRELLQRIEDLQGEIVGWALSIVPVDIPRSTSFEEGQFDERIILNAAPKEETPHDDDSAAVTGGSAEPGTTD